MGLELFGMRSAPMIGREHERDVLWSAITECEERRVPALILLCGAGGVGKTRLTEWVEQCAHELGSANVLRAQFNEYPGHGDGIAPMLERFFRTGGLDREGVFERVARLLGEYGARGAQFASDLMAVVDILRPRDGIGLRHRSERESFLALGRTLGHIASERPVLLCVENVQWSEEAARFIESVIEHGTGRIAIVASLGPGTATEPITARLAALRGARSVESGRMPDPEIRQLLESLVRLAPRLLDHVVAEAQGNPRAAIELVTAWVQSGALEGSERGYVTGEHESTLPFSVGSMWTATVDRVCAAFGGRGPEMHLLIELAAVLGDAVDPNDWAAAAGQMGLALPASLIEALVFEGLLLQRDDVLRFRTNRVAEMIREGARTDHERWKTLNAACATVLDGLLRDSVDPHQLLRIGRHAVEAELWDFAFEALVHAGVRTHNASPDEVRATWELRNQALERMNAPPDHEQFLWNECLQASLAVYSGDSEHASQILEGVAARCGAPGRERLLAYATRNLAVLLAPSDPVRAAIVYDRSIATYAAIGDVDLEGLTLCNSVNLFAIMGQVDEARARLGRARQLLGTREGTEAEIELTYQEGQLARLEGDLESAHRLFEKAAHLAAVAGWSARAALALSDAADAMRMLGRLDEAEEVLLRVLEIASAMGQKQHYETIRMNLSLIASERGEHEKAWELACAVREAGMRGAIEHFVAAVHLPAAAGTGRFEAFDDAAAQCEALSAKFGVTDWDLAWTAGEAGDLAVAAGETARAERAYKLALEQLRALGSDKGDAVQAKLRALRERR